MMSCLLNKQLLLNKTCYCNKQLLPLRNVKGHMKMDFKSALYQIIGSRIKQRRIDLDLSQEALAQKIDLARTSVSNIEIGRQQVTLSVLYDICQELETNIHTILPTFNDVKNSFSLQDDYHEILMNKNLNTSSKEDIKNLLENLIKKTLK
jgi:transcriptional regulator with XRE-family HTH domain